MNYSLQHTSNAVEEHNIFCMWKNFLNGQQLDFTIRTWVPNHRVMDRQWAAGWEAPGHRWKYLETPSRQSLSFVVLFYGTFAKGKSSMCLHGSRKMVVFPWFIMKSIMFISLLKPNILYMVIFQSCNEGESPQYPVQTQLSLCLSFSN